MSIHDMVKRTITEHKSKIEAFQMATIAGVASLVYSEYLRKMKQKYIPVHKILVAPIRSVQDLLKSDGQLVEALSSGLIDSIAQNELFIKYQDAPEFELFKPDHIEVLKTIFDLYIIPNLSRRIPETIAIKFQLNGDNKNQLFVESYEVDLFGRQDIGTELLDYVVEEIILQMLMLIPTMSKSVELPEENFRILMNEDDILTIENSNAICPIHFDVNIFENKKIMELLEFVTNTSVERFSHDSGIVAKLPNGKLADFRITTNNFNTASVTTLNGIRYTE